MNEFDNINGFLIEKGEKLFNASNRAFKYGDGLFETMRVVDNEILFLNDHIQRLKEGMAFLKLEDAKFDENMIKAELAKVIYKNYYKFAKLRLAVYRESPGMYTPFSNSLSYIIEGVRYDSSKFNYDPNGITLNIYDDMRKNVDMASNIKSSSALVYVMASLHKKETGVGDSVVLNNYGRVCETSNANIFIVKDGLVKTPALTEGPIKGVLRSQILKYLDQKGIKYLEGEIQKEELKEADEIFTSNMIVGIQTIKTFEGKDLDNLLGTSIQEHFDSL